MAYYSYLPIVCKFILEKKQLSGRKIARSLNIHPKSWQRYCKGTRMPGGPVKYKMVTLMGAANFSDLVAQAYRYNKHRVGRL